MRGKWEWSLLLSGVIVLASSQLVSAQPIEETKSMDAIEWIAFWDFPQTREGQLERLLTTELQRRILLALQDHKFLYPGKEHLYRLDPFHVKSMREIEAGFVELDVIVRVHQIINNEMVKKADSFQVTFRHHYDKGFYVTSCKRV